MDPPNAPVDNPDVPDEASSSSSEPTPLAEVIARHRSDLQAQVQGLQQAIATHGASSREARAAQAEVSRLSEILITLQQAVIALQPSSTSRPAPQQPVVQATPTSYQLSARRSRIPHVFRRSPSRSRLPNRPVCGHPSNGLRTADEADWCRAELRDKSWDEARRAFLEHYAGGDILAHYRQRLEHAFALAARQELQALAVVGEDVATGVVLQERATGLVPRLVAELGTAPVRLIGGAQAVRRVSTNRSVG
ncbi:Uncharacterized protein PBTT_01824 [Plasmodiophora brassicae]